MIKTILKYIWQKKQIVREFIDNSTYLEAGEYLFDDHLTYIYHSDFRNSLEVHDMFKNGYKKTISKSSFLKSCFRIILKNILEKHLIIHNKSEDVNEIECGVLYVPALNGNNFKIFNLKQKIIFIKFKNKESYHNKICSYLYFKDYFLIPKIIEQDRNELYITEEYIQFKSIDVLAEKDYLYIIDDMFNKYINYLKKCQIDMDYILKTPEMMMNELNKDDCFIDIIKNDIADELKNTFFPYCKMHGDLWLSNILLSKEYISNKIYYIDWEHSNIFIIFYDLFFVFFTEAFINKKYELAKGYISGVYDEYFSIIFNTFSIQFNKDFKLDYLIIFMINYYSSRCTNLKQNNKIIIINQLKEVLDIIKNFKS